MNDKRGRYSSTDLTIGMTEEERPNQAYPIQNPRTGRKYPHNPDRVWRFEPESMKSVIDNDLVIWPDENLGQMERPRYKTYFDPMNPKIKPVSSWIDATGMSPETANDEDEELQTITSGLNSEGGRVLRKILGKKVFNYPKPPSLLRSLVRIASSSGDIVLDSFAGSGTTAHATLEINALDKQERKFVLIQQPHDNKEHEDNEFNVCREVTVARMKNVMLGYTFKNGGAKKVKVEGLGGTFTYARVGEPLFSEYRDLGDRLPAFAELAKYIFYTETSHQIDLPAIDEARGYIGAHGGTSYYLFYTPNEREDREISLPMLAEIKKQDENRKWVIYSERIWMHQEDLQQFERENNVSVRNMLVPFNLK